MSSGAAAPVLTPRDEPITIGERAPEFALKTANAAAGRGVGESVSLAELVARGPVIVEFLRGTWWPNCVKRMAQFEPMKQEIESKGATVVYVAAEKRDGFFKPEKFLERRHISFPFLLDEERAVTKAYGVYNRIALDAYNIAKPATFVVGGDGVVKYAYVGKSQADRAPMELVIGSL